MKPSLPALRGALLALLAAVLFGLSTPLLQRFGSGVGPFATAALLYGGAALAGTLSWRGAAREARLRRADAPRLLAVAVFGAVIGPVALAWGLQRTSATSASLLLTLEALFTAVFAWRIYGETLDRRVGAALALLLLGGMLLVADQGLAAGAAGARVQGLLAVLLATAAWGVDNSLSRALAERDPGQVVFAKALLGAAATTLLAVVAGESRPALPAALALFASARPATASTCGCTCSRSGPSARRAPARCSRLRRSSAQASRSRWAIVRRACC